MKNKNLFAIIAAVLVLTIAFSAIFAVTAFADSDETEILLAYQVGDTTLDGKINIKDATAIQKHVAKLAEFTFQQLELADADKNGAVNVKDATYIQKLIAGLIDQNVPTETQSTEATEKPSVPLRGESATTAPFATEASSADEAPAETVTNATETVPENTTEAETAVTDPAETTEATQPQETAPAETVPAETTEATEPTEEKDDYKPITLPFVPAP